MTLLARGKVALAQDIGSLVKKDLGGNVAEKAETTVRLDIKRQDNPNSKPYWNQFELRWRPGMNVISALMDIAMNPVDRDGKQTMPITYDSNCLEEVCGSCAMRINGRAAMACSALLDKLGQPIRLEPLS